MKKFIINSLGKIKPLGMQGLTIHDVTIFFYKGIRKGSITTRSSSLAFNFFLAFFPFIIIIFSIIPYIPISNLQETLIEIISSILPPTTNKLTFEAINDIIINPRGDILSISFILTLFFSTNGVNSLIESFNISYHINESRSIIRQRILSLAITLILSFIIIITISLIIFSKVIIYYLIDIGVLQNNSYIDLIIFGKWIIILTMLLFGISFVFHFGPALKRKWKLINAGSVITTSLIILTSFLFNYYIDNFSQYNKIYGSIGTLMIILIWIYVNSIILLIGFELNASIMNAKKRL